MDKKYLKQRILEEEDYIRCPKFSNSLSKFLAKNEDGADNATIAKFLMISEEEVEEMYQEIVLSLRKKMVK